LALPLRPGSTLLAWSCFIAGDRWPVPRSLSLLVGGLGSIAIATLSALGTYDTVLLSVHMVQHMILNDGVSDVPRVGSTVTLALRTLPTRPRALLLAILHSRLARVLTFAPLTLALFHRDPFALYYSPFYEMSLRSAFGKPFLHLHFIIIGSLLDVAIDGHRSRSRKNQLSHADAVVVLDVALPCVPWASRS
jgi:putative copper resistance protein D